MEIENLRESNKACLKPLEKKSTNKKIRCFHCNKKSMIVTMCKCEKHFCLKHNQPEDHNCSYDFKLNRILLDPIEFKKVETI